MGILDKWEPWTLTFKGVSVFGSAAICCIAMPDPDPGRHWAICTHVAGVSRASCRLAGQDAETKELKSDSAALPRPADILAEMDFSIGTVPLGAR
jgi:hypothetical protein